MSEIQQGPPDSYGPPVPLPGRQAADTPARDESQDDANASHAVAFVYVPTRPYRRAERGQTQHVRFELRQLDDGSPGLPIFTTEERLVAELGSHQPYIRIAVLELLVQIAEENVRVVINPRLKQGAPRWTEDDLQAWRVKHND